MSVPKVKVCGMREIENIREVARLPLDMMGFIFYPRSPRVVKDAEKLSGMLRESVLPKRISRVGVFVNAAIEEVLSKTHAFDLDYIQLHGGESPSYCAELQNIWRSTGLKKAGIIKAFSVGEEMDFDICSPFEHYCSHFLFDTKTPEYGGSGKSFPWELLADYKGKVPFLLSGGIGPDAVTALRHFAHPLWAGIDVNSRFETAPGLKDTVALEQFIGYLNAEVGE